MKRYLQELVDWMAERLLARAAMRAVEIVETATRGEDVRALPAPKLPQITFVE